MTTATLIPPIPKPNAPGPRTVPWTVPDFHRACEMKFWGDGKRMILIRGEVMELGPMNPLHATGVDLVNEALRVVFPGWRVRVQTPLVLGQATDPIPDLSIFRGGSRDFLATHPATAALVVEVADSSLYFDMTTKAELYAKAGIPDYWILDLEQRRLLVYRDPAPVPEGAAYRTQLAFKAGDTIAPLAKPDAVIAVAELLP